MKKLGGCLIILALNAVLAPSAWAHKNCWFQFFGVNNYTVCVSQHGNITWLGPSLPPSDEPTFIYHEGYGISLYDPEHKNCAYDFGPIEGGTGPYNGFDPDPVNSAWKLGNVIIVTRTFGTLAGQVKLEQYIHWLSDIPEVRIFMVLTNYSDKGKSIALHRAIARGPTGPASYAERSVFSWGRDYSHGVALTEMTPQDLIGSKDTFLAGLSHPDTGWITNSCASMKPAPDNRAGGYFSYSVELGPFESKTRIIRYRPF